MAGQLNIGICANGIAAIILSMPVFVLTFLNPPLVLWFVGSLFLVLLFGWALRNNYRDLGGIHAIYAHLPKNTEAKKDDEEKAAI